MGKHVRIKLRTRSGLNMGEYDRYLGIKAKNIGVMFILTVLTLCFYSMVWACMTSTDMDSDFEDGWRGSPIALIILFLIPIYYYYWFWKNCKRLGNESYFILILAIVLTPIFAPLLMQHMINKYIKSNAN